MSTSSGELPNGLNKGRHVFVFLFKALLFEFCGITGKNRLPTFANFVSTLFISARVGQLDVMMDA